MSLVVLDTDVASAILRVGCLIGFVPGWPVRPCVSRS